MNNLKKILIVDDIFENLLLLKDILEDEGYDVSTALGGQIALDFLESNTPDLILLDIRMPDIDGFEVCRQIKNNKKTSNIPVIFITAVTDLEGKIKGLELGAADYITKPFQKKELFARIKTHLTLREKELELLKINEELKTSRKITERNEKKYKDLYKKAPFSYQSLDINGNIKVVNTMWLKTLGYKKKEVIGKRFGDFLHSDYIEHFKKMFPKFKKQGHISDVQLKIKHKNNSFLLVSFEGSIDYYPDGGFKQTYCVFQDITKQKEAEKALKSASLILNRSRIVAFTWKNDENWTIEYVSENVVKLLEYSAEELMSGKIKYADCIVKEDLKRVEEEVKKHSKEKNSNEFLHTPYRIVTKSGKIKIVKDWTYFEKNEKGEIIHYRGIVTDITKRKKDEEEIKKLSIAVEQSPSVIAIASKQGKFEYVNSKFSQLTGYSKEEIIGQRPSILKSGKTKNKTYKILWKTILKGKEWRGEFINKKKNGELFFEAAAISPIINSKGEITNFIKIAEDITVRKKLEEKINSHKLELEELVKIRTKQLWHNERKFKAVFDQAAIGVVILNMKTSKYLQVNQKFCDLIGYEPKDVLNMSYLDITHPEDIKTEEVNIKKLTEGSISEFTFDKRYVRKDKTVIWVNITASSLVKTDKNNYSIVFVKNITDTKIAREKLRETYEKEKEINKMKSQFVSMASHEFRTPLAGILFTSDFLKKYWNKIPEDARAKKIEKIETQVKHMTSLLDDVLVYGKIENKLQPINITEISFEDFFKPIFEEVYASTNNSHKINVTKDKKISILHIDKKIGRTIFINLLTNAIKFSPNMNYIDFIIEQDSKNSIFKIRDYGIGINSKDLKSIFIPFNRAENAEVIPGTGLGLSIVLESLEILGGKILVESEIKKETTFTVILPIKKELEEGTQTF